MPITIALAGNPNSGKTTMFNVLTGNHQYVGNRPGVTVEQKVGHLRTHKCVDLIDLPGIYSLSPYTMEEVVTRDYLIDKHPNAIMNLVDASNIERNLYLTTQLCEVGFPVVIALNMMDLIKKNGDEINVEKLSIMLDCKIIETSALKETGLAKLSETAVNLAKSGKAPKQMCHFSKVVEVALSEIRDLIEEYAEKLHMRWFTIKVFERDERVLESLKLPPDTRNKIDKIIAKCEAIFDDDSDSIIINQRYDFITNVIKACVVRHENGASASEKIDNIMTNRWLALPLFAVIMCGVYYISIQSLGSFGNEWVAALVEWISGSVEGFLTNINVAPWLVGLVVDGFINGVGAVLGFVPQLMLLFLFLAVLEDCGYMSRIAFIMDRLFRKFGLSGKSFIPLLVASGCGVPGIMACRTIESENDRKITIMVTTFIPCGAKLPIISLIAGALFGNSALVAISVYFLGILMVVLSGAILKKLKAFEGEPAPFVMELPSYHVPSVKNVLRHVLDETKAFVVKAGTIIFVACGIIWFLSNFSWQMQMVDAPFSILASIGSFIAPIFSPLGFGHWEPTVATLTGVVAKENIVGSLNVLYGSQSAENLATVFTPVSGYAFLIFNMLCSPCIAAIATIKREMGSMKWTMFALLYQTGLAYIISFIIYQLGNVIFLGTTFNVLSIVAILLVGLIGFMTFRRHRKVTAL
ncbi:MAG: ferrous iron transport protein B [Oscillospiraceae bacterium]